MYIQVSTNFHPCKMYVMWHGLQILAPVQGIDSYGCCRFLGLSGSVKDPREELPHLKGDHGILMDIPGRKDSWPHLVFLEALTATLRKCPWKRHDALPCMWQVDWETFGKQMQVVYSWWPTIPLRYALFVSKVPVLAPYWSCTNVHVQGDG